MKTTKQVLPEKKQTNNYCIIKENPNIIVGIKKKID